MKHDELVKHLAALNREALVEVVSSALDARHEEATKTFQPYREMEHLYVYVDNVDNMMATSRLLQEAFQHEEGWKTLPQVYQKVKAVRDGVPLRLPLDVWLSDNRFFQEEPTEEQIQLAREVESPFFDALDEAGVKYRFQPILGDWITEPGYDDPFKLAAAPAYGLPGF